jgi:hypothetical protein
LRQGGTPPHSLQRPLPPLTAALDSPRIPRLPRQCVVGPLPTAHPGSCSLKCRPGPFPRKDPTPGTRVPSPSTKLGPEPAPGYTPRPPTRGPYDGTKTHQGPTWCPTGWAPPHPEVAAARKMQTWTLPQERPAYGKGFPSPATKLGAGTPPVSPSPCPAASRKTQAANVNKNEQRPRRSRRQRQLDLLPV